MPSTETTSITTPRILSSVGAVPVEPPAVPTGSLADGRTTVPSSATRGASPPPPLVSMSIGAPPVASAGSMSSHAGNGV